MSESEPVIPAVEKAPSPLKSIVQQRREKIDAFLASAKEKVGGLTHGFVEAGLNTVAVLAETGTFLDMTDMWRDRFLKDLPGKMSVAKEAAGEALKNAGKNSLEAARGALASARESLGNARRATVNAPGEWCRAAKRHLDEAASKARLEEAEKATQKLAPEQLQQLLLSISSKMDLFGSVPAPEEAAIPA